MRSRRLSRSGPNFLGLFVLLAFIIAGFFAALQVMPLISGNRFGKTDRLNIAVVGPKSSLLSLNLAQKSAVIMNFPDDLYMTEVAFGYGKYRMSSVFGVGELDKRGGQTVANTLQEFAGIPIDGFVTVKEPKNGVKQIILSKDFILGKSDLNLLERAQVLMTFFSLRDDKIKTIDVGKLASPLVLADGSVSEFLEKDELDNFLSGVFFENKLQDEDLRVEVVNTTKIFGLGSRASRLLSNIGLSVVNVDSTSELLDRCRVEADDQAAKSKTVERIAKIFDCSIAKAATNGRASVRVLVGTAYAKKISLE